ncbi:RNA-directed DNA polymerase [Eilatimonas milleporae]|uniref:Reverse transcriptase (RNA-dependent DNA polymerase) n=1 Tax=Eilatimonas milleporae TaxID=911205 RepID=A0A3M0CT97_9PROT|nr:RNA-directed DNA polymerase [Eilatimonas milleporae]RMB12722.1 hypothetical protein BXY39_0146 [Eilatimonas milleporae]
MVSAADKRYASLLDNGFYPAELPPVFKTNSFSAASDSVLAKIGTSNKAKPDNYAGSTTFYDGATFRGHLRTFGIINPINYMLVSKLIANKWASIQKTFKLSKVSGARPSFSTKDKSERSIQSSTLSKKSDRLQNLAACYPVVLNLDINRFYGSIYTHSIPWAVLGKAEAKLRYSKGTLKGHWSDKLDTLVRNCNQRQTVGIPIGPDTSRIVSELLLSRIDVELCAKGTGLTASQIYHSIDDYQVGVFYPHEAEQAQSLFQRVVHRYEMRINDFKTGVSSGIEFGPSVFQRHFDVLKSQKGQPFIEHLFELIYSLAPRYPNINIIGYALKSFRYRLANHNTHQLAKQYLQRLTYASPHEARWTLPLLLGIYSAQGKETDTRRFIQWGIEVSARRNDVLNLLWFLYAALYLRIKLDKSVCFACIELSNHLVDLMLIHGKHEKLFPVEMSAIKQRYLPSDFNSPAWIVLYEVSRHGWNTSPSFSKAGTVDDPDGLYLELQSQGVEFYQSHRFSVDAFSGWHLTDAHFTPEQPELEPWEYDADASYDYFEDEYP